MEALSAFTQPVVCAVTLLLYKLPFLTHRCAVLACLPPMPLLCEMHLWTGLAQCGCMNRTVLLYGRAWWTLVTQKQVRGDGVPVLVLLWHVLLLEGPRKRGCEEH